MEWVHIFRCGQWIWVKMTHAAMLATPHVKSITVGGVVKFVSTIGACGAIAIAGKIWLAPEPQGAPYIPPVEIVQEMPPIDAGFPQPFQPYGGWSIPPQVPQIPPIYPLNCPPDFPPDVPPYPPLPPLPPSPPGPPVVPPIPPICNTVPEPSSLSLLLPAIVVLMSSMFLFKKGKNHA